MRFLLITLAAASLSLADILFEDDFNDGNADGWYECPTPATYQVNDSLRYEMSYTGTTDSFASSRRGDNGMTMSLDDYSVRFEVIAHWPTHNATVEIRFNSADSTSYTFTLNFPYDTCYIGRYDSWTSWTRLSIAYPFPPRLHYDVPYWIRFECEGNTLRAKIWQGTAGDEPPAWLLSYVDYTYVNNGCMSLGISGYYPEYDFDTEFDNVMVTDILSTLEQTTWGNIKAAQF